MAGLRQLVGWVNQEKKKSKHGSPVEQKASARSHWSMEETSFPKAWLVEHSHSTDWEVSQSKLWNLNITLNSQEVKTCILCQVRNYRPQRKNCTLISTGSCSVMQMTDLTLLHTSEGEWGGLRKRLVAVEGGSEPEPVCVLCCTALPFWRSWCCRAHCAKYPSAFSSASVPRNWIN